MPTLHDFRADFRMGRTGQGLRIKQDTRAYKAGLLDARNMMVLSDNNAVRRWGTLVRRELASAARIEPWVFAKTDAGRFIMVFENAKLTILDPTMTERAAFTGMPWTDETMWFMTLATENNKMVIADTSFQTQIIEFDAEALTFSASGFEFDLSDDLTRLRAPFFQFADKEMRANMTIFTAPGQTNGYAQFIATALGIPETDFNLSLGTGKMSVNQDFFVAGHVGTRLLVGGGEVEVLSVSGPRDATVKVHRDLAVRLDVNPFFIRRSSRLVEVAAEKHGFKVGDSVFFYGLSRETSDKASDVIQSAVVYAGTIVNAPAPAAGAKAYTVIRVPDPGTFEIQAEGNVDLPDQLYGGSDVYMIPTTGLTGVKEPAFSGIRGWPQTAGIHETRLWLGGTEQLPDAAWASRFASFRDFDPGTGAADDAMQLYGIGEQARIRHFISTFDLIIMTDNAELYIPGSTDVAVSQETVRAVPATEFGTSFTKPFRFDLSAYFLDASGNHIRSMELRGENAGYQSPAVTIPIPDWVKQPKHSTVYRGAEIEVTPYLIWGNATDGSLLVMHSSKNDEAFGFMRWDLADEGSRFVSCAGLDKRLYAVAERDGAFFLLEFDTSADYTTVDFAETLADPVAKTEWLSTFNAGRVVKAHSRGRVYSDITVNPDGAFVTPEPVTEISIGDAMPWQIETNAPVSGSGQGPKAGKMQRLVSAEIHWIDTETGFVEGQSALNALDNPALEAPIPVDEWREYHIGKWGREPRMIVEGEAPGHVGLRGMVMNVYF